MSSRDDVRLLDWEADLLDLIFGSEGDGDSHAAR